MYRKPKEFKGFLDGNKGYLWLVLEPGERVPAMALPNEIVDGHGPPFFTDGSCSTHILKERIAQGKRGRITSVGRRRRAGSKNSDGT